MITLETFTQEAQALGFETVLVRDWPANEVVAEHSHPFGVHAIVAAGDLWLAVDGHTQHLRVGDRFTLPANQNHTERYGPQGATYWVGRRG
jgi:quercetin dioxygenase-like cupin family protein